MVAVRGEPSTLCTTKLEALSLLGMAIGVVMMLQPWWDGGMRFGFFVAATCTVLQIVFGHLPTNRPEKSA